MANELQNKLDAILEDKNTNLLPEHLKAGVTCLGVKGNFEGNGGTSDAPVKLFETVEEMDADPDAQEGDLAVIYREETQNWDGVSVITGFTFPKTVILPSAMTGSCYGYSMGDVYIDIDGSVSASSASFRIYGNDMYQITYTSSDGLTYTRTDTYDETLILADEPIVVNLYDFSEVCGYFMQVGGNYFEGLFEYTLDTRLENQFEIFPLDANKYDMTISGSGEIYDIYTGDIIYTENDFGEKVKDIYYTSNDYMLANSDFSKVYAMEVDRQCLMYYNDKFNALRDTKDTVRIKEYDLINDTTTEYSVTGVSTVLPDRTVFLFDLPEDATYIIGSRTGSTYLWFYTSASNNVCSRHWDLYKNVLLKDRYMYASTQLTLNNANQLLPGVKAYGNKGVITGDGTIYTQISNFDLFQSQGMDLLNNYTILATNTTIDKLGDVDTLETIACEYKKFDKPEELAEYDIHRIQNDTKYLAIKGGLEYRLYDLDFNLLDTLTFTEKQDIATLDSFMLNTSDLLLYKFTGTTTTHYRWIRITDKFEKIDYSIVGGTSAHIFAYHVFNDTLYLAFDNGGSYMYIYKLTTSGAASQLYKASKVINYVYQGFANFCEYENNLYCSLVCNYNSTAYVNDVVKITSSGSATAVYSGAYSEPMVVTVNGYAVSKNGTYRVTDFTTPVSTVSRTYSQYSNYTPYYDEVHDAIIDYDYLYIGISGSTFRRDETLRTVIPNVVSEAASSLITDISKYEVMTILNIPMEDGIKLSFDMTVYLNKGESDKGYKLINLLNLDTSGRKNLYLGCTNTL